MLQPVSMQVIRDPMSELEIREEQAADRLAIRTVTEAAFRHMPYAGGDEQDVIERLRTASALTLSLVALENNQVIGQITFSPATVTEGTGPWFALGPVSVVPAKQGYGVGSALITEGLGRISALGALGCILTGNPDYYSRFGFHIAPTNTPDNEAEIYFQLKLISGAPPVGRFCFHPAFYGDNKNAPA
jgi:putative acetyltransferase